MVTTDPLARISTLATPQTVRLNARQVENNAGGFVYNVDAEQRLRRFLVLGTSGGSYYQGEPELTRENATDVINFAQTNGVRLVEILTDVSVNNRAPKVNPTVFSLAIAASLSDEAGRKAAFDAMPAILRTGTHFMLFHKYVKQFRGWGMGLRKAGQRWLDSKSVDQLAYQMVKYRSREGYTQRDLLRLIHPVAPTADHDHRNDLYGWVTQGRITENTPKVIIGFEAAQKVTTASEWVALINQYGLSWEMLPDAALKEVAVWNAILDKGMPMTALIRQLPRLTNLGIVGSLTKGSRTAEIVKQITDAEALKKARIHPYNVLVAGQTYASGHSLKGSTSWTPNQKIVDALDEAFYSAFGNVVPANKPIMLALDVSGSMSWSNIANSNITPRVGAAAMALVTAATEPEYEIFAYSTTLKPLAISPKMRLQDALKIVDRTQMGGTDCALPFVFAKQNKLDVDGVVSYTDSETWAGGVQVPQAARAYRDFIGKPVKSVVVGMVANRFTVNDPSDLNGLDIVGWDSSAPSLISDFIRGDF